MGWAIQKKQPKKDDSFGGGLLYAAEKLGLGAVQSVEGMVDFLAGGIADLFGADEWAERQFRNTWLDYTHADQWYDAKGAWKVVGDVAGGIGTSVPSIAIGALLAIPTGGASVLATGASLGATALSSAGMATSEALEKTGELTGKEYLYGALVGGTEGVIEWASQKIGFGSGRITKSLANALGREAAEATTEAVVKQGIKGTLKNLGKTAVMDFMGEATEEMIAEFAAPIYERMTINPNAKLATAEEIGYAGFVGGLSGLVMGSGTSAIQSAAYIRKGSKVQKEGNVNVLLAAAEEAAALEKQYGGDNGIQETYDKLKDSLANEKPNAAQKVAQQRLIGELSVKVAVSEVMPVMMSAASQVVSNVDAVVQSVNDFGYTDAEGNPVNITREELLGSLNPETMTAEDVRKELQNNQYLAHFAAASTFNTMMMNADLFADNAVSGEKNITDEDVAAFVRSADPNKMRALSEALGIDDWSAETGESMTARRELLRESGALDKERAKMASRSEFASVTDKKSGVPLALTSMKDGITRYADGSTDIGIKKDGDTYTVYDYNSGEISRDLTRGEVNKALKEFAEKRNEAKPKKEGKVTVDESIDESQLSQVQKQSLKAVRAISKAIGVDIVVFESETETVTDAKGKTKTVRKGYNGKYNPKTKTVYVDIAAGMDGEGTVLFTLSHELTHHIKNTSPAMYKAFQDFLLENYGKKGVQVGVLVARQMAKAKSNGRSLSYAQALDEVIADSCESFLADPKIVDKILGIKKTNLTLWETIKAFLEGIFAKVNNAYRKLNPDSVEGKIAKSMVDVVGDLKDKWAEALLTSEDGISFADAVMLSERGIGIDPDTNSAFSLRYTVANDTSVKVGKKTFDAESIAVLVSEATGRSLEDARRWVKSEMSVANDVIADAKYLDYEPDKRYAPIKKNSDYPQGTVDLGNLCPKREEFTSMFDLLQKKHPNKVFTAKDVAEMRGILSKHHITVACGACFVEDRRQLLGEIADTFIDMWKDAIKNGNGLYKTNAQGKKVELFVTADLAKKYGLPKGARINATDTYVPNQYDLTTYEGFKTLERDHPIVALGYIRYNNSRGQQAGRLIEGRAEYDRQILGWSAPKVRSVNNNGGLRIFSFSDFEVVHLLDLVQVIIDCAAKGVKIQGYTKSPAFARLVRNTGIKLNRSLIPKGDTGIKTVDGKRVLDIDNVEGINTEDENYLDEADNPNVGNVIIGINPEQIGIAMLDPNIDYIIPFHSNKAKAILKALGLESWVNYKESQHEKDISTGKASAKNVNIYTDVIAKYNPKNKVEFVEAFIKECKEQGKIPRYAEFLNVDENGNYAYREGYHKLLVDFKMFDSEGNILLQDKIVPDLDDGFMAELMAAEVTKKSTYEFPQEVYAEIEEKFGKEEQLSDRGNGYDGYSMSNNARRAYEQGEKPISRWSKEDILDEVEEISPEAAKLLKGVKLAVLREHVLHRTSWHHTSDHYNRTDFYSIDEDVIDGLTAGIVATWTEAPKPDSKTYRGDIRYLEWGGTKKHPKATEKSLKDVNIEERGSFYIITDDSGNEILRKKIGSNGTYVRSYAAMEAQRREAREREERRIRNSSDSANQFYDEIKGNMSQSTSGSLYPYGKKPSQADHANGLDKFFSVGDRRLTPNGNGGYTLETWSGSEWVAEDLKLSDRTRHIDKAVEEFGYTPYFSDAGYILPDGKMLNFSGEKDKHYGGRGLDHRAIATVYDDAKGTPVIARFMAEGNIRVNAASQGIDLGTSTEPTVSQYNTISRFISECKKKGRFYVDFTDAEGNAVGSLSYEDRFSTDQVITDIKEYYRTGVVPDQDYYQAREVKQSLDSAKGMTDEKAMRIIKRYASAKSYTKGYAKRVLKEILGDTVLDSKKTYNELSNVIWKVMDEAPPANKADTVAEDVAEYITDMLLKESDVSAQYLKARETMQYFKDGYGRIVFSEEDLIALEKILGENGLTKLREKWGHQKGKRFPISMADFVRKKTELGTPWMSLQMKKDAEAFVEIAKIYDSALKESADGETAVTSSEIEFITGYIKRSILNAYSKYRKSLAYNLEECKELLDLYNAINSKDGRKMIQMTTYKIGRLKDLKIGKYKRLSSVDNDTFKKTIGLLANTTIQGGISLTKMGKALRELSAWYSQDSVKKGFFGYSEGDDKKVINNGAWDGDIALAMDYLWKKQVLEHEAYTKFDYKMLYDVLNYFEKFISNYEKVWRNGKYVEAAPIAKEMYDKLLDGIEFHSSTKSKALAAFRAKARSAFGYILDPEAAIHSMEGYSDGFYTQEYENLREAAKNVEVEKMNVLREHDEFMDAHPNYLRDATQGKTGIVIFNGKEVTRMSLIQLYMTFKRQHAQEGLIRGGVTFDSVDGDGKTSISGDPDAKVSADLIDASMAEIDRYLTVEDHEYIAMVEKAYEACKVLKAQRDFAKYGKTNVIDGYYVPIKRYGQAISVDTNMWEEMDRVSHLSFNKDTVEGANSSLYIEDAERVLMRHVRGICLYYHLSPVIDEVNMLANIDLGVNPLQATTIATESSNAGIKAMKYLSDMISDVQGIGADNSGINRLVGAIRGGYAAFQIGGNPKVWATQFTSLVASTSILDADSVAQGLTIPSSDVDEYCDLAELRHYDNAAARAMSLADKSKTGTILSRISEKSTALIGACDRVVIGRLFGACQVQAEKNTGHKVGTKENKREAGKILEKVIFQTQQNSLMTEKSLLMRSKQEFLKSLTMFSADAMKVFGRVYDSFGYLSYLQEKKKRQSDSVSEEDLKMARKKLGKAVGAWVSQALAMVGITMLFNFLYNKTVKRDEDETKGEAILKDCFFGFIGNLLGGMPLIRDISGYFIDGYEIGYNVYDSVNETVKAVENLSKFVTPDATSQERASAIKGAVNAIGMITGIPTRNVYNAVTGLIRRFSEPTGYAIDSVFYEKNYESDLDDAIEDGDEEMVDYLLGLIYDNAGFSGLPEKANKELVRLANNGKKILPKTVPDKKSINGEEVELTDSQKQDLADIYTANVNKTIGKLVNMGAYNKMSDEDKEITLKNLYDLCMDDANTSVLDINNGEKHSVSSAIGYAKYAVYMTKTAPANKETKDKRQKKLEAIKKLFFTEEEKLMLFAKDYALKDGDFGTAKSAKTRLLRYILSLSLSKEEREILAKSCGFKVENGSIKQDW